MANTGALGTPEARAGAAAPSAGNAALANAAALGGTGYLTALYNNSQSVNNQGKAGYDPTTGLPLSPTTQAVAGGTAQGGTSAVNAAALSQILGPYAQYMLSGALAGQGLATDIPNANLQTAELTVGSGYSLANALLGEAGIGVQEQGLASQMGTSAAQQGIEQAQYGIQQGQFPEQAQQAALQNALNVAALQRQGAIGGTTMTTGYKEQQGAQAAEYGWQQADIYRNQQLAQLGQLSEQLGYGGQQAGYANQLQQLNLSAKSQGLNTSQAYSQLKFGLNQLGVQSSPEQYVQAIANAQGGAAGQLQSGLSLASLLGGGGPNPLGQ